MRRGSIKTPADRALAHAIARGEDPPPMPGRYAYCALVRSPMRRPVELHVFPGRSAHRALVIGGVHGTEAVGVEVTRRLVANLRRAAARNERPFFTTLVVPALFPDNLPASHGGQRHARRATRGHVDPNRQFPSLGAGLDGPHSGECSPDAPRDSRGRRIERANVALLELIRRFEPQRIASVHAIRRASSAGVYSDPHRGAGTVLGAEAADLAAEMHAIASDCGGHVPGSRNGSGRYPHQGEVGEQGISLGAWGSAPVITGPYRRDAIPVITLELVRDWSPNEARRRRSNVEAFMRAIRRGFLEP